MVKVKETENEKEKECGRKWTLFDMRGLKMVITKESYNNKGNGNQDFSDAHVLSAASGSSKNKNQTSSDNKNQTSSDKNNVDSGKPNEISSHADIKHAPNSPVTQQHPPRPTATTTSPPSDLSKESFNNKGNEKQDLSSGDISSRNQKSSVLADDDKVDLGWWKKQTTSPLLSSPADINSASSANWNHTLNPPLLSSPDAINNPSSANWNHTLNPPLPSLAGLINASLVNWNHTLNPPRVGVGCNNYPTPAPHPFNHPTAPIPQPLPAMQGQVMCNGCKRIWPYPPGTSSVTCPWCKHITYVSPPAMQRQLVPNGNMFPQLYPPRAADVTYPLFPPAVTIFEDSDSEDSDDEVLGTENFVHVYLQQLPGIVTIVQGINNGFNHYMILKDLMTEFCCNGRVVMEPRFGMVIHLFGDQRRNVYFFLLRAGIVRREYLIVHGPMA